MSEKTMLSVQEVAEIKGVTKGTVRRWLKEGKIKRVQGVGKKILIYKSSILDITAEVAGGDVDDLDNNDIKNNEVKKIEDDTAIAEAKIKLVEAQIKLEEAEKTRDLPAVIEKKSKEIAEKEVEIERQHSELDAMRVNIEDRMIIVEQRELESNNKIREAESYISSIKGDAESEARRTKSEADSYADRITDEAEDYVNSLNEQVKELSGIIESHQIKIEKESSEFQDFIIKKKDIWKSWFDHASSMADAYYIKADKERGNIGDRYINIGNRYLDCVDALKPIGKWLDYLSSNSEGNTTDVETIFNKQMKSITNRLSNLR